MLKYEGPPSFPSRLGDAGADYVLVFQTDSLLVGGSPPGALWSGDGIDRFLDFDYVGAPWHK